MQEKRADVTILKGKIKIFLDKKLPVHVTLTDGEWLNGYIEEASADFFMLKEFRKGTMPVFHLEIKDIDKYKKEEVKHKNGKKADE